MLARLAYDADILLDLHCDDEALQHVYMMPQHWPAGADLVADLAAEACLLCDDSGGRCFDETFSLPFTKLHKRFGAEFPIPPACFSATVEFRGQCDVFDEFAEADAKGLYRFLQRRGAVAGVPDDAPALAFDATPLDGTDMVEISVPGILAYKAGLGDRVAKGQLVAEILDPVRAGSVGCAHAGP
ncbi:MAG: succinylglutamate desuccinylase/aspartoacylase family protein [Aliidongia sp.]